jgi:hypothetical protein
VVDPHLEVTFASPLASDPSDIVWSSPCPFADEHPILLDSSTGLEQTTLESDDKLRSRDWRKRESTVATPREAWRCCEDRLVSRVGESGLETAGAINIHIIAQFYAARYEYES